MDPAWVYFIWAILLIIVNVVCWCTTFITLPGNWFMVGVTALFAWVVEGEDGQGIGWTTVIILIVLAGLGELVELLTGAAGAAKQGGSRRSIALSVVGALVGSIGGAILGLPIPIPIIGSAVGALFGAAMGAFGGAVLGEYWKGRPIERGVEIGRAAFLGRLFGTVGKLGIGVVMIVVVAVDALI